ncbi:MAG: PqiC family protein [Planctomycetota bacterium]|jgi:uncharacterized lipoprotein YmbA
MKIRVVPSTLFGLALAGIGLIATGCGSTPPTSFYMLEAIHAEAEPSKAELTGMSLGVGPVELPHYLDRPELVYRSGTALVEFAEFDQWAEPLQDGFTRVLAENLAYLVPARRTVAFPWRRAVNIDYQVVLQVAAFEADESNRLSLVVRWAIVTPDGEERVRRESRITEATETGSNEDTVNAMSRSIAELSREIAEACQSL